MKPSPWKTLLIAVVGLPISLSTVSPAVAAPKKKTMRDVVTHEQLVARRQNAEDVNPMASKFKPAEEPDPAKKNPPKDLISQSDFLCSMGKATLVPKRALIHVPDRLKDRTRLTDSMQIVTWPEFFAKNRAWITTVEVSRVQAEGKVAIDEKKMESLVQTGDVLVATMGGAPISVLPLQVPDEESSEDEVEN